MGLHQDTHRGIASPHLFDIQGRVTHFGGDQEWYAELVQRRAGCGPTACSNLLWYLAQTRPGCEQLCPYEGNRQQGFLRLMEDVWQYVTPGPMGVNSTAIFTEGAERYGIGKGVPLHCRVLDVPVLPCGRPDRQALTDFLAEAFADDLPVAFLNLSNGSLRNLDSWHWVTLVGLSEDGKTAIMSDQGRKSKIAIGDWAATTNLGGGFVALEPAE